jgi:hypothetical protein
LEYNQSRPSCGLDEKGGIVNKKFHVIAFLALFVFLPTASKAAGLTIRLYSGGNYLQGGDLNGGLNGWTDYWKASYRESGYPNQAGSFNPVHLGFLGGGDLIFQLSPRFGIGLGAEYFEAAKSSTLTFQSTSSNLTWTIMGKASALPAKASLFYFIPLGRNVTLSVHGGIGYYWAQTRLESHLMSTAPVIDYLIDAKAKGLGYHGGLGLEWKLFPKVNFLIEAVGRYASLTGFEGETTIVDSGSWKGKLYYWEASNSYISKYDYIDLLAGAPGGTGLLLARDAKIDFSGICLRGGIVIRL